MEFTAVIITVHLPHREPFPLGVLLLDEATDRLHIRVRTDLQGMADPDDMEVIQGLADMINSMTVEMGATGALMLLEDYGSNTIRLSDRSTICAENVHGAVAREFARHVG